MTTARTTIDDFLATGRIAFVGLSSNEGDFSRAVFRALRDVGQIVLPVNPHLDRAEGVHCYRTISEIDPLPEAVFVMTPPEVSLEIARQAIDLGLKKIWFHRGVGKGSIHPAAVELCERAGMSVVEGECPLMFLGDPALIHRMHGFGKRMLGRFPS